MRGGGRYGMAGRIRTLFALLNWALVGLGSVVMAGWYLELETVVRIHSSFVPTQFNTALGIALAGVGLLGGVYRRSWLSGPCGVLICLLGVFSLVEDVTGQRLGIDMLFLDPFITEMTISPGRPSPNSSLAFVVLGVGIACLVGGAGRRVVQWVAGIAGSTAAVMGAVPLLGYATGVDAAFRLVSETGMGLPTAVAFMLAGSSLTGLAVWSTAAPTPGRRIDWAPWAAGLAALVATGLLWSGLRATEALYMERRLNAESHFLRAEISNILGKNLDALQHMVWRIEAGILTPGSGWVADAQRYLQTEPYQALIWMTPDLQIRAAVPVDWQDREDRLGQALGRSVTDRSATQLTEPYFSSAVALPDGQSGFYVILPIAQQQALTDYLVALVDVRSMLGPLLDQYTERGYGAALLQGEKLIARTGAGSPAASPEPPLFELPLPGAGADWRLQIVPLEDSPEAAVTNMPDMVLILGSLLAALLGLLLRSRQLIATHARYLSRSKRGLEKEVVERGEELTHLATHDPLTGLPNLALFKEQVRPFLAAAKARNQRTAVLCLGIDHLQEINNSLGHANGDALLCAFAQRLTRTIHVTDILARLGGDEFVIFTTEPDGRCHATELAQDILEAMTDGFRVGGREVAVTTSVGIALYPRAGEDIEALVKNADAAMHQAKTAGRNTYVLYGPELGQAARARLDMRNALRHALRDAELQVYYQPQVTLADGRIAAAEALVRWERPGYGLVPPEQFIPLAEESDLIVQIDSEVLHRVAQDLQDWSEFGGVLPVVAVNVSARQLQQDYLLDDVRRVLASCPAARGHLEVELTERLMIDAIPQHRYMLETLVELGVQISIDDFGTGYSSFSYFRDFPVHAVKIDRSFIEHVHRGGADARIALAMIALANAFDMTVVAEGVELPAQHAFLRQHGCTRGQGWLFGRPMRAEAFITTWRRASAGPAGPTLLSG